MTPEQKTMAIWGSGLAAALLVGWLILDFRADFLSQVSVSATHDIKRYDESHPAQGKNAVDAKKAIKIIQGQQEAALTEAEAALVPALPEEFTTDDLNAAESTYKEVVASLTQKAERQGVKLAELPLKSFDSNPTVRRMQLAHVYLFRGLLDACIEAGAGSIVSVKIGSLNVTDPGEHYALLTCDIELETKWDKGSGTAQLLSNLVQRQRRKGYGIRLLEIENHEDNTQRVRLIGSLITANQPEWGLKPEGVKMTGPLPAAKPPPRRRPASTPSDEN